MKLFFKILIRFNSRLLLPISFLLFFNGTWLLADCIPGESGGSWVRQCEMYYCIPTAAECSHWVGGLQGYHTYSEEISGNIKKTYHNYNNPCTPEFEDRCPYLGGTEPPPLNWGYPVIWTYYMNTYAWECCPNDPNKFDPGICGCGVPDTDSDGDGTPDCNDQCPDEPDTDSDGNGTLDCYDDDNFGPPPC